MRDPVRPAAWSAVAALVIGAPAMAGCSPVPPAAALPIDALSPGVEVRSHPWHTLAHHGDGRFRNPESLHAKPSFPRVAAWIVARRAVPQLTGSRQPARTPVVAVDLETLAQRPERMRATWIGHSTMLIQTRGLDVLLDPVFSATAGPGGRVGPDRRVPLPLGVAELPNVDVVLISHDHFDHLDERSVRQLAERFDPLFLVPLGVGEPVRRWGGRHVVELDWWQFVDVPGRAGAYRLTCTPAQHNSGRRPGRFDRTLWAGWHLRALSEEGGGPLSVFYAGDTGYGAHFAAVRARLGVPDVAVLPIGAYEPRAMTAAFHLDPEEALRAFFDLGGATTTPAGRAPDLVPLHWGTFELSDEPFDEPPVRLLDAAGSHDLRNRVRVLPIGGSLTWTAPPAAADGGESCDLRPTPTSEACVVVRGPDPRALPGAAGMAVRR